MKKVKKNIDLKLSEKEISLERIKRKKRIMKFAGKFSGVFGDETIQSIKAKMG